MFPPVRSKPLIRAVDDEQYFDARTAQMTRWFWLASLKNTTLSDYDASLLDCTIIRINDLIDKNYQKRYLIGDFDQTARNCGQVAGFMLQFLSE